ncbi:hypothetical protein C0V75_00555 [Tabrizicola sp. TH137]|nr:hypothetical protein C0V75_00555 [Tabrizicola sp. TH137]
MSMRFHNRRTFTQRVNKRVKRRLSKNRLRDDMYKGHFFGCHISAGKMPEHAESQPVWIQIAAVNNLRAGSDYHRAYREKRPINLTRRQTEPGSIGGVAD